MNRANAAALAVSGLGGVRPCRRFLDPGLLGGQRRRGRRGRRQLPDHDRLRRGDRHRGQPGASLVLDRRPLARDVEVLGVTQGQGGPGVGELRRGGRGREAERKCEWEGGRLIVGVLLASECANGRKTGSGEGDDARMYRLVVRAVRRYGARAADVDLRRMRTSGLTQVQVLTAPG